MRLYEVKDERFRRYGRMIENIDFSDLLEAVRKTPIPEGTVYEPSVEGLEAMELAEQIETICYGEMPIQIGYCNGHNEALNAVEYHRSSEINVAATDAILVLGQEADMERDFTYDTSKMEAFLLPAGTAVEIFGSTLHYAPWSVNGEGFQVAVILPKGTNEPCGKKHEGGEDQMLAAKNKWLIGHAEGGLEEGSFLGLRGKNLTVADIEGALIKRVSGKAGV